MTILIKQLAGLQDYETTWRSMRDFTDARRADTADEIWFLQHPPVFTFGQAGKPEHLLAAGNIPVIRSDRGGQVTYHGPGQLIAYLLIDLKRRRLGVRDAVTLMESSLIALLREYGITAHAKKTAPGVYVNRENGGRVIEHKIASLGLRVRRGCCYHGLALNIDMDLAPFWQINPCGQVSLVMTQLADLLPVKPDWEKIQARLARLLQENIQ